MTRQSMHANRRPRRHRSPAPERLEERALLSFAAGDLTAFGADGPAARPVETSAIVLDNAGNRYISGSFSGRLTIGGTTLNSAGGRDAFVAKFAADGSLAYAVSAGGALDDVAAGIAVDATGRAYATGEYRGAAGFGGSSADAGAGAGLFVWSLNPDGSSRSLSTTSGGTARGLGVAVSPDGGSVAVVGSFAGTVGFGGTSLSNGGSASAGFIARLDAAGGFSWANAYLSVGGGSTSQFDRVGIAPGGAIVAAGRFAGTVDFDPSFLINARVSVGSTQDVAVVSLNAAGQSQWTYTAGGAGFDAATGVAVDGKGRAYVAGAYQQSANFGGAGTLNAPAGKTAFFVLGFDAAGNTLYATDLAASHPDLSGDGIGRPSVAVNDVGNVVVATTFSGPATPGRFTTDRGAGSHALVETFDGAGRVVRALSIGGSGQQVVTGVAVNAAGRVALTGSYTGLIGLGNFSALDKSAAGDSAFAATLAPVSQAVGDFFGLNRTQPTTYNPTNGVWSVQGPFGSGTYGTFGQPGDIPVPGDYLNYGVSQMAVFRPSTAQWIVMSRTGPQVIATFGATNLADIPAPADFDGVGHAQPAVFRPATGEWFVLSSNGSRPLGAFGGPNGMDVPVPADYDGDGLAEPAVFRVGSAEWFAKSATGARLLGVFGSTNPLDLPAPGDFNGDGKAEPAVYRRASGEWYVLGSNGGVSVTRFGTPGGPEIPAGGAAGYLKAIEPVKPVAPPPAAPVPTPVPTPAPVQTPVTAPRVVRRPTLARRFGR